MLMDKMQIAALLKDARVQNKMSVEEVAAALRSFGHEIMPKTIYNYETGNSMPQVPVFLALCRIYGIDDIFDAKYHKKIEVSALEETLVNLFRSASSELRSAAIRVLAVDGANDR